MKTKTAIIIAVSIIAAGALAYILLKKKSITPKQAQKMSDKELQSQMQKELKLQMECMANQAPRVSKGKAPNTTKIALCMKTHAENVLTLGQELKKRLCSKNPTQKGC